MAQVEVLNLSLKSIKAEIDSLKASLVGLDKESQEYKQGVEEVIKKQDALNRVLDDTRKDATALDGSYNALTAEMSRLKKEFKATNDEAKRQALGQSINEINNKLKELDATIGNHQRSVGDYEIATRSLKGQISDAREEIANLLAQGLEPTDAKIQELIRSAGSMRDALQDANNLITQQADDTRQLSVALDVFKTGAAAVGLFQSAMVGLGIEDDTTLDIMKRMQATMLTIQSLTTIQTALTDKQSKTYQFLNTVYLKLFATKRATATATQAETVANTTLASTSTQVAAAEGAQTTATVGLATAEGTATVATSALALAMTALPIFAIIAGVTALVSWLSNLVGSMNENASSADRFSSALERIRGNIEAAYTARTKLNQMLKDAGLISETTQLMYDSSAALSEFKGELESYNEELAKTSNGTETLNESEQKMLTAMNDSKNSSEARDKVMKEHYKTYVKTNQQIERLEREVKTLEEKTDDLTKAEKRQLEWDKQLLASKQGLISAFNSLGRAQGAENAEETKRQEEAEKARQKAEEAARKAQQDRDRRQREYNKGLQAEARLVEAEGQGIINNIRVQYDLARAARNTDFLSQLTTEAKALDAEKKKLETLIALYDQYASDVKLSDVQRAEWAAKSTEATAKLIDTNNKLKVNITEVDSVIDEQNHKLEVSFSNLEANLARLSSGQWMKQIMNGIVPAIDAIYGKVERQNVEKGGILYNIIPSVNFKTAEFDNAITVATDGIQDVINDKIKKNGFEITPDFKQNLSYYSSYLNDRLNMEKSFREELKGVTIQTQEDIIEIQMMLVQKQYEDEKKILEDKRQAQLNYMSTLDFGSDEYAKANNEYINIQIQQETLASETYIKLKELEKQKDDEVIANRKKQINQSIKDYTTFAKSMGSLLGAISDAKEEGIKQDVANGKISQERAEEEFERVKRMKIAELWITTLAGAAGAFLNDMGAYSFPFNAIIAALDFGTAMATGIAQTRQIKQQQFGDSGGGGGAASTSSIASVGVSPLLNEELDPALMTQLDTSMAQAENSSKEQRVYILQSDLEESSNQVKVREENTTF